MQRAIWMGVFVILVGMGVLAASGACAIDDEVVWVTETSCTGDCTTRAPSDLSCDGDRSCSSGCDDWDCNEGDDVDPADAGTDVGEVGTDPDGGTETDVPDPPLGCEPVGGGGSVATAQTIVLGDTVTGLTACPRTSQWFRFAAAAGTPFVVDVATSGGGVSFLLYAGDELGAVAGADADGEAAFSATANTGGEFYLRFRSAEERTVDYAFSVRTLEPR